MSSTALLLCLVAGVSDGDKITVRCGDQPQAKVRLAEIVRSQPHRTLDIPKAASGTL